ncbi:MAG: hypothetical protein KJ955_02805 [Nanoarchaeota archaeon]|nr:hypothetical protein [Nanoarchaeota archaeon]
MNKWHKNQKLIAKLEYSIVFYTALPLCLIAMHPRILSFLLNIAMRILKKPAVAINITYFDLLTINLVYAFYWLFSGTSLFMLIRAVYPLSWAYLPYLILAFAVAWAIGFLSIIFPAGLGIREGILLYMLSAYIPVLFAAMVAIAFRGVILLSQGIFASIFLFEKKNH